GTLRSPFNRASPQHHCESLVMSHLMTRLSDGVGRKEFNFHSLAPRPPNMDYAGTPSVALCLQIPGRGGPGVVPVSREEWEPPMAHPWLRHPPLVRLRSRMKNRPRQGRVRLWQRLLAYPNGPAELQKRRTSPAWRSLLRKPRRGVRASR